MIGHPAFPVEPWRVRETTLSLDLLAQSESIFALSNGHVGLRGNLDEGEPYGMPGTYLNGLFELRPLPYGEAGYGFPESGQTVINVSNGKLIRLLADDEPFDIRYGDLRSHERTLDFRSGTLLRQAEWTSPAGRTIRVLSQRLVSFTQRAVAAISYEIEPVDGPVRIVIQSELVSNESLPQSGGDPRLSAVLEAPLVSEEHLSDDARVLLVHMTKRSALRLAAGMDHQVQGPSGTETISTSYPDLGRVTVTSVLQPGQGLRLIKFLGYGWSSLRSRSAMRDQVSAILTAAVQTGWDGLVADQRAYLGDFWDRADVEVDGDAKIQQAVRFGLFHVLQAGARAETRAIPAKGLTGPGYDGHAFWDSETFVLSMLTYTAPSAAADALRWRQSTLPMAIERALQLGLRGAAFPWRSIDGKECSAYWPAGTAAFHVGADIADAVLRYVAATGDEEFERKSGLELVVQTARLWCSLGHYDAQGSFRIDGVTGPDEYSALVDNNVYTNLMAQQNLRAAAQLAAKHIDDSRQLGVDKDEMEVWRNAADAMFVPYDETLGIHPQAEGFTQHEVWDFERTKPEQYPLLLHFPYFDLYRKQVVKQADLVLAMVMRTDAFSPDQKARNFDYYEGITVRDSSLSASIQAVMAAEVGHMDLARDYLTETALMDLQDIEQNLHDGVHLAALAGSWVALVAGFGGMRVTDGKLRFAPRMPASLTRMAFTITWRTQRLRVEVTSDEASYSLSKGEPLTIIHHGQPVRVGEDEGARLPIPPGRTRPRPKQPLHREPVTGRE